MARSTCLMLGVLVAAPVLVLSACKGGGGGGGGGGAEIAVTGVALDRHELSLAPGASARLVANVLPENATRRAVAWSIEGAPGVSVAQDGTVSSDPASAGTAVVTVTTEEGHFTSSCSVTVQAVVPGQYRYVAAEISGLKIIDVRAPHDPRLEATQVTKKTAVNVFVRGAHAYVAESGAGLEIFDVGDPAAPVKVGECATRGWQDATAVWVDGDHAYVADYEKGLTIVDVTDPSSPALAGSCDPGGRHAVDVTVSDGIAYLVDRGNGVSLVDVRDPRHPALITTYAAYANLNGAAVVGDRAFLADSYAGLVIVDVSVPATPTLLGTYDTAGFARDVAVAGDYAYVADGEKGLAIVDVRDPADPVLAGTLDTEWDATGVTVAGDHAYVADADGGLVVVDVSDPHHPSLAGLYNLTTYPQAIEFVEGGIHAYVADASYGLRVVGWLDETRPGLSASLDTPGWAFHVAHLGDRLYLADGAAGLEIVNVTVPGTPGLIETVALDGNAQSVTVDDGKIYVSTGPGGLYTWNLSDPTQHAEFRLFTAKDQVVIGSHVFVASDLDPRFVVVHTGADPTFTEYDFEGSGLGRTSGVARYGNLVYLTSGYGVFAVNVENPDAPHVVGGPWAVGVTAGHIVADADYLYVAGLASGLTILNRSTGDVVGSVAAGGLLGLDVHGNRAYAVGSQGLVILDVSDRAHPHVVFSEGRFMAVR